MGGLSKRRSAQRRTQSTIDILLTLSMFVAVGVVIWRSWPAPPPPPIPIPAEPIALSAAPTKGNPTASVMLIEYSDFECRYCGSFARDTLPEIDRLYLATGKLQLAYRHLTPPNHPRAMPAAIAADCAGRQGKFWEMHDRLFGDQGRLDDADFATHARSLEIDIVEFKACQGDPAIAERIGRDTAQARGFRIAGTPAFFVGRVQPDGRVKVTQSLRGAVPLAELQRVLDSETSEGLFALMRSSSFLIILGGAGTVALCLAYLARVVRRRRTRSAIANG